MKGLFGKQEIAKDLNNFICLILSNNGEPSIPSLRCWLKPNDVATPD